MTDWESLSGRDLDWALAPYAGWTDIKDSWSSADNPPFLVGKWRGGVQAVIPQYHASIDACLRDLAPPTTHWFSWTALAAGGETSTSLGWAGTFAENMYGATIAEAVARSFGEAHERRAALA